MLIVKNKTNYISHKICLTPIDDIIQPICDKPIDLYLNIDSMLIQSNHTTTTSQCLPNICLQNTKCCFYHL